MMACKDPKQTLIVLARWWSLRWIGLGKGFWPLVSTYMFWSLAFLDATPMHPKLQSVANPFVSLSRLRWNHASSSFSWNQFLLPPASKPLSFEAQTLIYSLFSDFSTRIPVFSRRQIPPVGNAGPSNSILSLPPPDLRARPRGFGFRDSLRLRDAGEVRFPQGNPPRGREELHIERGWGLRGVPQRELRVQGGGRVHTQVRPEDHREGKVGIADGLEGGERQGLVRLVRHQRGGEERLRYQLLRRSPLRLLPRLQLRWVPAMQLRLRLRHRPAHGVVSLLLLLG